MLSTLIRYSVVGTVVYLGLLVVIIQPSVQRGLIYLNWINYPFSSNLNTPHKLGFPKGQVHNFRIDTSDGVSLGAWQFLPIQVYKQAKLNQEGILDFDEAFYLAQLRNSDRDVVLYFHGNAANRGSSIRYSTYDSVVSGLDSHLIAIDYRGFGDSSGTPSEEGLLQDGLAAWDWLIKNKVDVSRITIVGHSLGTGVASRLVSHLNQNGIYPKAMVLTAPFTSIGKVMFDFRIFRLFPVLYPLKFIPNHEKLALRFLLHHFDTLSAITKIETPFIIFHGSKDTEISPKHSWRLFNFTMGSGSLQNTVTTNLDNDIGKRHVCYAKPGARPSHIELVELQGAAHNDIADFPEFHKEISAFWKLISG